MTARLPDAGNANTVQANASMPVLRLRSSGGSVLSGRRVTDGVALGAERAVRKRRPANPSNTPGERRTTR
jgi:hypothetical protein